MIYTTTKIRNLAICLIGLLLVSVLGWLGYDFFTLRVVSTNPNLNSVATASTQLTVRFNHAITKIGAAQLNSSVATPSINDTSVVVTTPDLQEGETYTLTLENIEAIGGRKLDKTTLTFTAKYIDYADLPASTRQQSIQQSDSGQSDDPFMNNAFPLAGRIDKDERFLLNASLDETTKHVTVTVTLLDEVPNASTGIITPLPTDKAEQQHDKIIAFIKEFRGTPERYTIDYRNSYLNAKYSPSLTTSPTPTDANTSPVDR